MNTEILFVGPLTQGGMTSVILSYAAMYRPFRLICSYRGGSPLKKRLTAALGLAKMALVLIAHPSIRIVHIHTASNNSFRRKAKFAALARKMGRKVVMHVHGGGFKEFYATDPDGIRSELIKCDEVVCLSETWADFFRSIGIHNLSVINNPVQEPVRVPVRKDGLVHILFLGLIDPQKGIFDIVEMIAEDPQIWRGRIKLHIGGEGPSLDQLHSFIEKNGIADIVHCEGWVKDKQKQLLMSMADIVILPSYIEGLPISILEAMTYGIPVVSTPVGGIPSLISDGENGLLCQPGDKEAFRNALSRLVDNKDERLEMGRRSLKKVAPYTIPEVKIHLDQLYSRHVPNA